MLAAGLDTFPRLLLAHAKARGNRPSMREKDLGIWQIWTWSQVAEEVRAIACGLALEGLKRGQHLAIIGENRPRLYWTMAACQAIGAIPVPLYQDAIAQELKFIFQNAEIAYAVAEDQEQVDKLIEILPECSQLKHIYYDNPRGLRDYTNPELKNFDVLQTLGRDFDRAHPHFYEGQVAFGSSDEAAIMLYTSGTTGNPKGVVLTHKNLITAGRNAGEMDNLREDDDVLAYLPMAWVGQNIFSYTQPLVVGFCVNCPESGETAMNDMREIGPTYYFAPPRVLEGLLTQMMIRMEDAAVVKRWIFHYFMKVAAQAGARVLDGKPVSFGDWLLYTIGDLMIYAPLRNALGMSRVRVAYTAGEAIGEDLFHFYRSIGINLKQLYGSTETSVFACMQRNGEVRAETVGPPAPGVEVKIIDSGEVLIKSPGLFKEYYKNPKATAESRDAEGWFHTGDAGYFDVDGHLRIIDRAKDVGKLIDSTLFSPKYIENKLKFSPFIKEAVAVGNHRAYVCVILNIDFDAVGDWAERHNLPYSSYTDLAGKREVYELIEECIEKVNHDLAQDPRLSNSQIHRFLILHKELDADDGELTRTRKVRRRFIEEKYQDLVDALYGEKDHCAIEAQVIFEDGRIGTICANLAIHEPRTFPITMQAKAAE
jgi:long-chain acyl-CoA synthetase